MRGRLRRKLLVAGTVAVSAIVAVTPLIQGGSTLCDRTAGNASELTTQSAAASSGQTLCLTTSGDYGQYVGTGNNKALTITAADGVSPTLSLSLNNGDSNLTVAGRREVWGDTVGIKLTGVGIFGTPGPSVTVKDNWIEGNASCGGCAGTVHIDGPSTPAILFDHNVHYGTGKGTEAAIRVDSGARNLTIQRSLFRNLSADGVKIGGSSHVRVRQNRFHDIHDRGDADIHSDGTQLNSEDASAEVEENWFSDCDQALTAFDFLAQSLFQRNVVQGCGSHSITIMYDAFASTIRWNTIASGANFTCGNNAKYGTPAGVPYIYNNNFPGGIVLTGAGATCVPSRNNFNRCATSCGTGNVSGTITYVGGSNPSTFTRFEQFGLVGNTDADDGTQVGVCGGGVDCTAIGPPREDF